MFGFRLFREYLDYKNKESNINGISKKDSIKHPKVLKHNISKIKSLNNSNLVNQVNYLFDSLKLNPSISQSWPYYL